MTRVERRAATFLAGMSREVCKVVLDTLQLIRVISHTNALFILTWCFSKRDAAYFLPSPRGFIHPQIAPPCSRDRSPVTILSSLPPLKLTRTCRKVFAPPIFSDWRGSSLFTELTCYYFRARTPSPCRAGCLTDDNLTSPSFPLISAKSLSYWSTTRSQS